MFYRLHNFRLEVAVWLKPFQTQNQIFTTSNRPQKSAATDFCKSLADYSNTTASTAPLEIYLMQPHTPTHPHVSNNFPPPAACCGSWSAASVNWLSAEEEEKKEEGAAGHELQRRWRPIGNQCTMSISAPYGQNTRSDSCHSTPQPAPHHGEREDVHTLKGCAHNSTNGWKIKTTFSWMWLKMMLKTRVSVS